MPVIVIKCYNRRAQGLLAAASQQCPWLFLPGRICTHSVQGSPACNGGAGKKIAPHTVRSVRGKLYMHVIHVIPRWKQLSNAGR